MRCPFHDDSHASAAINYDDNCFVCHACGAKGDTIKFVQLKEGVQRREAYNIAERILREGGVSLPEKYRFGRRVPDQEGYRTESRKYVPPRGRRGRVSGV